jgi:hypothetical protein
MSVTLDAYAKSPSRGFGLLAPIVGQETYEGWSAYVAGLRRAIADEQDLLDLDWARALFLTEIGFISDLVGFGRQFRSTDERGIVVLRSLQVTIHIGSLALLFIENATYPWIREE